MEKIANVLNILTPNKSSCSAEKLLNTWQIGLVKGRHAMDTERHVAHQLVPNPHGHKQYDIGVGVSADLLEHDK